MYIWQFTCITLQCGFLNIVQFKLGKSFCEVDDLQISNSHMHKQNVEETTEWLYMSVKIKMFCLFSNLRALAKYFLEFISKRIV